MNRKRWRGILIRVLYSEPSRFEAKDLRGLRDLKSDFGSSEGFR